MRKLITLLLLVVVLAWSWTAWRDSRPASSGGSTPASPEHPRADARTALQAGLPREALDTLRLIRAGGPFPHRQDGNVFQNRERLLPPQPQDYYREYTVRTPGARDRGARRIVAGGDPPRDFYYSGDHYRSFRRIDTDTGSARD